MGARLQIKDFTSKLKGVVKKSATAKQLEALGEFAAGLIRKRTRLGYGAPRGEAGSVERFRLAALSEGWIHFRKTTGRSWLSEFTRPSKSNLTFTGQMLDSLGVVKVANGSVTIGPQGYRTDPFSRGLSNEAVANFVAKKGRPFNNLTKPEARQVQRFYRNQFGDLLKNARIS